MSPPFALFALWLRAAPAPLHAQLFSLTVNHLLRGQPFAQRLAELSGKRFRLCVEDAGVAFTFEITPDGLTPSSSAPDVTIRGPTRELIALALRAEDPDTLFFQRRLAVEGETQTGVHLKNLLDGWEYDAPAHVRAVLPPPLAAAALRARGAVIGLRQLVRLRRTHSHRNIRPEETAGAG